jgi:ADP-heptose:LPS heptosyltransferase
MLVKFLIIRFSSIGDIVLTTPVVRCLKQQIDGAEIHYVTKKQFAPVVANNPYIDKVHILDGKLKDLVEKLKSEDFHYIIDLHHNLRSLFVKNKLDALAFSFNKINIQKWLMVAFKIDRLPKKHLVDRYMETCSLFDIENDNKGLDFFIDPSNEIALELLPQQFQSGYLALVIGAKHATKQLPDDKIAALCSKINAPILLLGGPDDKEKADRIKYISGKTSIYNTCGIYNLQQSASLVKNAKIVITHDTGLMHIAAAFKKVVFSIWGNTIPKFGMYPYLPDNNSAIFEVEGLKCRPCNKIGYQKCPKGHFDCMNKIDLDSIAQKCNSLYSIRK